MEKIPARVAALQLAALGACIAIPEGPSVVLAVLLLICTWTPLLASVALSLGVIVRYLNPSLVALSPLATWISLAIPILAGLRFVPGLRRHNLPYLVPVWVFSIVALLCSVAHSAVPSISAMKIVTFAWDVTAVILILSRLDEAAYRAVGVWLFSLTSVVALLSLCTLVSPGIAYIPETKFLRGILNHSQALGCVTAPLLAGGLCIRLLRPQSDYKDWLLLALVAILVLLTRSRTAAVASLLGVIISLLVRDRTLILSNRRARRRVLLVVTVGLSALIVGSLIGYSLTSTLSGFVLKRGETKVSSALTASRGQGALSELRNFANSPVFGNGFGVYPNGQFPVPVTRLAGIPISAPVEKGFLPTAVLEETGTLGGIAFVIMLTAIIRQVAKKGTTVQLSILLCALFTNLGEATLLSPGGIGMYLWILIGYTLRGSELNATAHSAPATPPVTSYQPQFPSNLLR
jgi:O-Antigen ligase